MANKYVIVASSNIIHYIVNNEYVIRQTVLILLWQYGEFKLYINFIGAFLSNRIV